MWASTPPGGIHVQNTATVVLHGRLAEKYGRRHKLGVTSAPEAAHALCALIPEFRADFQDGWYRVVRGRVADGVTLTEDMLALKLPPTGGEIHFLPVARGGKNGGGIKAVLGAVILVAAVAASSGALAGVGVAGGGLGGAVGIAGTSLGFSWGSVAFFGATMLLSGVSALLTPTQPNLAVDSKVSYTLSGNTNSTTEGTPIPVVYGRTRVGSIVGSFGYYAEDFDGVSAPVANDSQNGLPIASGNSGALGAGGGGKGGGTSSSGATEAPNTLRSRAVVRIIDILSEGPIGGLVNGPHSIYFNNTPLMASDGSYNFQGVSWEMRTGYPSQDPVAGYPASELTTTVNVQVQQLGAGAVTRTYSSPDATAARVTMRIPALYHQNTTNGNLETFPSLQYKIEVAVGGSGAFHTVVYENFANQKCTSPYQKSYRFDLPYPGVATSWDIRVTRVTADATTTNDQSSTFWDATTLIVDQALMHPNVAYMALEIDSASFGSSLPTRAYEIDGILCQVPLNYDPVAGSYATQGPGTALGTWDGASWKTVVTSNPAWCTYDMFANARYGLGLSSSALNYTKFDLFTISQYCDGAVPGGYLDGNGNTAYERRYQLNVALTQQVDAYRLVQSLVSSFRGMAYWGAGRVVITADMPTVPTYVLNNGNVLNGEFNYEGSPLKSRHTIARVAWIDPQNSYQSAIEVVEDFDAVVSQGQIPVDIVAFGCTSRGLAHRWGKWMLDTEKTQTEMVSCGLGLEQLRSRPGDVVRVADPAFSGVRMGGRLMAGSTSTRLLLDAPLRVTSGLAYFVSVTLPDGTIADRVRATAFDTQNLHPNNPAANPAILTVPGLPLTPDAGATYVISTTGDVGLLPVETRQFRVLALAEPHRGQYQLSGLFHDPNKYARVEYGIQFDPTPYSTLNGLLVAPLPPPSNVSARDYMVGVGSTTIVRVTVGFTPANDVRVVQTQIHCDGPEQRDVSVDGSTVDIDGLQLGEYVFRARSVGKDGRVSIWVDSPQVNVDGIADPPDAPTAFTAQGGAMQVKLFWTNSLARDIRHYELWRAPAAANGTHPFPYGGFTPFGSPQVNNASVLATVAANTYLDTGDVLAPDTAWSYWIRAVNTTGSFSSFAGPIKALTTYYLADSIEEGLRNTAPIAQALLGSAPIALANLDTPGAFEGQLALNASDAKLYRWNSAANNGNGAWQLYIPLIPNALGQITDASIADLDIGKIQGAFTPQQAEAVVNAIADGQITDAMIAGLTASKVNGPLSNATMQAGRIYDVDPVTGAQIAGVDVGKLLGTIGATQITDGAVTTQKVAANAIEAGNIAAGAITANKLAIAGPGNVIGNPCCPATSWGWLVSSAGSVSGGVQIGSVTGDGIAPASFALAGEGAGAFTASGTLGSAAGDLIQAYWDPDSIGGVQCSPGDWWEAQARLGCHRCYGQVSVQFLDASGAILATTASGRAAGLVGGATLAAYSFVWTKALAPANAARVRMVITAHNDNGGDIAGGTAGQNPYVIFTRAVLAPSTAVAIADGAQPQPYTIGGVTQIVGGAIKTGAITARQISAGTIDASKLSVGSVSNVITNSCCTVSASGWTSTSSVAAVPVYSNWLLAGYGSGVIVAGSLASGAIVDTSWAPDGAMFEPDGTHVVPWGAAVACSAGDLWEAQAQVITASCSSNLFLAFLAQDTTGAWQIASTISTGPQAWATPADGKSLGQYHQQAIRGTAPGAGTYNGQSCPNGATLVTLMLRMSNDSASQTVFGNGVPAVAQIYFTRAALGLAQTAVAPMAWAPGGSTQIDGGMIKTQSIVAGALAVGSVVAADIQAGSITAAQLAAGTITADKLAVGSATNLIWNSCPDQGTDAWTIGTFGAGIGSIGDGNNFAGTALALNGGYRLSGSGSGFSEFLGSGPVDTSQGHFWDWNPAGGTQTVGGGYGLPVQGGKTYGGAAYLISGDSAHAIVQLLFYDYNYGFLTAASSPAVINNTVGYGLVLANYTRVSVIAVAPPTATFCVFRILMTGDGAGAHQPFMAFTQAQFSPLADGATVVGDYQPGGVTTISGGMIRTNSLNANRITAASITATQIAAGSISADKLLANDITAGQIRAGAIGATQIAANSIRSTHLASDFILASSAQFGTAVIDSAQIKNLAVDNSRIAYGAITLLDQSYNYPNFTPGGSFTAVAQVSAAVTDSQNRGALITFTFFADGGGTQTGNNTSVGGDNTPGSTNVVTYTYGNAILLRHYYSSFDGSSTYTSDLVPYTGQAVGTASGSFVPGSLQYGNHTWVLYTIATGQTGTTVHVANLVVMSLTR